MHNTYNIHKGAFEPCHIADEVSPFIACERKSAAHEGRFYKAPCTDDGESVAGFTQKGVENANMQKNNNNMSNL